MIGARAEIPQPGYEALTTNGVLAAIETNLYKTDGARFATNVSIISVAEYQGQLHITVSMDLNGKKETQAINVKKDRSFGSGEDKFSKSQYEAIVSMVPGYK